MIKNLALTFTTLGLLSSGAAFAAIQAPDNGVVSSVCFLISHNLFMLLVAIPLHLFGFVMTLRDDRIFEILFVKSTKCPPRSRAFWAADSYSA